MINILYFSLFDTFFIPKTFYNLLTGFYKVFVVQNQLPFRFETALMHINIIKFVNPGQPVLEFLNFNILLNFNVHQISYKKSF